MRKDSLMKIICNKYLFLLLIFLANSCSPDEEVFDLNPNAGPSFIDIENEGYVVQLNAVPVKKPLIGTWRIYIGENGRFEDVNDPRTKFYGEPGESYQLGWEISNGDQYEASIITVSFKAMEPVILSPAIDVDTLFNNVSHYLKAEEPKFGASGHWEIVSGSDGRIENDQLGEAEFIGKEYSAYTLRWVLTYGSKEEYEEITFRTDQLKADAGPDRLDIKNDKAAVRKFFNLEGFLPAGATGGWEVIRNSDKAVLYNIDNPNSLVEGIADSLYQLTWKVVIDGYESVDTVDIRFRGKWGMFKDSRDNQTYKFTEINGLEWMAENFNYAANPGNGSWYYGYAYRAVIQDGHAVDTEEDRKKYGRLYDIYTAETSAPEGWRLPTAEEVDALVNSYGGIAYAKEALIEGGESGFNFSYPGYLSFSSSSDPAFRNVFMDQDNVGMFWTSSYGSSGYGLGFFGDNTSIETGTTIIQFYFYALPVRYVREVQ
ncbi:FISUMP domain-containing protein [Marinigracilibium pacificum]|uniref:Fibrobacter succinogenes major paralogous domain-containing protein n=1 Tax=Marinigracilibium pacificum TaxID=2729599 RepID=A0A848IXF0_9BACT|nr:FISUMP domain-containing protein [Marinigracilibium pacificum]NMM48326.1 hypothetical protein [Marinigracilibium pacificum]